MPYLNNAITPIEKFSYYSLDYKNPNNNGKTEAYEKGLGYTIHNSVVSKNVLPYEITKTSYGIKNKYRISVKGPNGKTKMLLLFIKLIKEAKHQD